MRVEYVYESDRKAWVRYDDGTCAPIIYGRYQVYEGSARELRRFAAENAKFPTYSTADQFLTNAVRSSTP